MADPKSIPALPAAEEARDTDLVILQRGDTTHHATAAALLSGTLRPDGNLSEVEDAAEALANIGGLSAAEVGLAISQATAGLTEPSDLSLALGSLFDTLSFEHLSEGPDLPVYDLIAAGCNLSGVDVAPGFVVVDSEPGSSALPRRPKLYYFPGGTLPSADAIRVFEPDPAYNDLVRTNGGSIERCRISLAEGSALTRSSLYVGTDRRSNYRKTLPGVVNAMVDKPEVLRTSIVVDEPFPFLPGQLFGIVFDFVRREASFVGQFEVNPVGSGLVAGESYVLADWSSLGSAYPAFPTSIPFNAGSSAGSRVRQNANFPILIYDDDTGAVRVEPGVIRLSGARVTLQRSGSPVSGLTPSVPIKGGFITLDHVRFRF